MPNSVFPSFGGVNKNGKGEWNMNKVKLALVTTVGLLIFACKSKTDVDFSTVPIKGANGEYQYIDIPKKGKIVINPQFAQAHLFRDGLALVKTSGKDGKWGYIDTKGKVAITPVYSKAQDFSENVAWVQLENQPPMLIDKKGEMILQMDSLIAAYPFNDGIARIKVFSQGQELTMFIDKEGKPAATTVAGEKVSYIKDGLYSFQDKSSEKWGFKNKKGEIAINAQFDVVTFFLDGMAVVSSGKKWGAIDKKGNFIISPQYEELMFDGNGLFLAQLGNKWGWVNKKNEITINPQFDESIWFNGSKLAPVRMGDKWGYINKEGQIIINPQFRKALPFNGDYAMVVNTDGKVGFIDKTGIFVVSPLYDNIDETEYLRANSENLFGLSLADGNFDMYEILEDKIANKTKIDVTRDIISFDRKEIVKTATVSKQDSLNIKELYDALQSKREMSKDSKVRIQIDPNINYDVFFKILATASAAGYADIDYASKINGNDHAERVNLTEERDTRTPEPDYALDLAVVISDKYIEIRARGGSLPKIFYKECLDGSTTKLCVLHKESEEDPGKIVMSVYSKSDSAYLDRNNEFITELSAVKPGAIVKTLAESSLRKLACGQSAPGVEDICIDGNPAISLRPRSAYDELAKTLIMIHNRFIDSPDIGKANILADDNLAIWKVLQVHHEARRAGFSKRKFKTLSGKSSKSEFSSVFSALDLMKDKNFAKDIDRILRNVAGIRTGDQKPRYKAEKTRKKSMYIE